MKVLRAVMLGAHQSFEPPEEEGEEEDEEEEGEEEDEEEEGEEEDEEEGEEEDEEEGEDEDEDEDEEDGEPQLTDEGSTEGREDRLERQHALEPEDDDVEGDGEEGDGEEGDGEEGGGGGGGDSHVDLGDPTLISDALDRFVVFVLKCRRSSATGAELTAMTIEGEEMMAAIKAAFGALRPSKPLWHKLRHVEALWRRLGAVFLEQDEQHGERLHGLVHAAYDRSNKRPDDMLDTMATYLEQKQALMHLERQEKLTNQLLCYLVVEERVDDVRLLLETYGADWDAKDEEGDTALCLAASQGHVELVRLLLSAGADVELRGRDGATPLVEACMNGHLEVMKLLLDASAKINSRWNQLSPIQWAKLRSHEACVAELQHRGAVQRRVPVGGGDVLSRGPAAQNRLRPLPAKPRLRRKAASIKAAVADDGEAAAAAWPGCAWVRDSLLSACAKRSDARMPALKKANPCLTALANHVRKYLRVTTLPKAVLDSFSLRPGVRLRAKDDQSAENSRRLRVHRMVDASCFAAPNTPRRFVEVKHDPDGLYKHYFGELLLCFTFTGDDSVRHDCCMVGYLFPDLPPGATAPKPEHEMPLTTKYRFGTPRSYEVIAVEGVAFCAALFTPLPLDEDDEPSSSAARYWMLNDDLIPSF